MRILGIDTTTGFLCLALYDGVKIYEYNLEVGRRLSEFIGVTLDRVLYALGWKPADIDYFACGIGPGSFTGMRVGVATIKGLAWALKKPIAGIPTLDILAQNVRVDNTHIIPVIDARRSMVYYSVYRKKEGILKRLAPYTLSSIDEMIERVSPLVNKKKPVNRIVLGDGLAVYKQGILSGIKGAVVADKDSWYPKGNSLVALALNKIADRDLSDAFKLKPIYLYPKECQIKSL